MGRTREFDVDDAVDRALHLFWQKGYEGTSLSDLTEALGINRPSLYAAFGSKEGLFTRALERYVSRNAPGVREALEAPTAREVAERMLRLYADAPGRTENPRGCLLVQGALACSDENDSIRSALAGKRHSIQAALVARFEKAKREGDLGSNAKPSDLARYVFTMCNGFAVQAAGGATREQLRRLVPIAMWAWPDGKLPISTEPP